MATVLESVPPFDVLPASEREILAKSAEPYVARDQSDLASIEHLAGRLHAPATHFYIVFDGAVQLVSPDKHLFLGYRGPLTTIGLDSAASQRPYRYAAQAVGACAVFRVSAAELNALIEKQTSTGFMRRLVEQAASEHDTLARYVSWVTGATTRRCIAAVLLAACEAFLPPSTESDWRARLTSTQEQVILPKFSEASFSNLLDISPQMVSDAFADLFACRAISREMRKRRSSLTIESPERLLEYFDKQGE